MPIGLPDRIELSSVPGIRLNAVEAGVRYAKRLDLSLIEIPEGASTAAVFTKNAFCAAPVVLARRHLAQTAPRFLLINSGNANAGTGEQGMERALATCKALAAQAGCAPEAVLPFSTGVIGEPLPVDRITAAVGTLHQGLSADNWGKVVRGIMTTDTVPKGVSRTMEIGGREVSFTGIIKGSGMIHPNMATMLCYIATDAGLPASLLQTCLTRAADKSLNSITVDGDTSTNDACVLIATGKSGVRIEKESDANFSAFYRALEGVCIELATQLIRDAEGITKFVTIKVDQARTEAEAKQVGYTVALSPLVKTAIAASDPNWGRILAAVGRAGLADLDVQRVQITLGDAHIVENGARAASYTEAQGQQAMSGEELTINISLGRGAASATVWTSDLTHEYVRINAEYRT